MGNINFSGADYIAAIAEIVGYKSGVALSLKRLRTILLREGPDAHTWPRSMDSHVRIRSEEFEDTVYHVLHAIGAIDRRHPGLYPHSVLMRMMRDPDRVAMAQDWMRILFETTKRAAETAAGKAIDVAPAIEEMARLHGGPGIDLAMEFIEAAAEAVEASPWGRQRGINWEDEVNLDDLFQQEDISSAHGKYFDLRFTKYLHRNFGDIDSINWRMFEKLTAEFFDRAGFKVVLGPGRGDGGVDVRAALDTSDGRALTVLVQCKRQKDHVGPGVVKELWAEVDWQRRSSDTRAVGLVVTTSRFTPGARDLIEARRYPIGEADRETLRAWIGEMRKVRNPIL